MPMRDDCLSIDHWWNDNDGKKVNETRPTVILSKKKCSRGINWNRNLASEVRTWRLTA
jgi:hypothetical protein